MKKMFPVSRLLSVVSFSLLLLSITGCRHPGESKVGKAQQQRLDLMVEHFNVEVISTGEVADVEEVATMDEPVIETTDPLFASAPFLESSRVVELNLRSLWADALKYSPQIKVFADLPLIRETGIEEAKGFFDPRVFAEGSYADRDDPVGSTLTTEENERFYETERIFSAGIDKKFTAGTEVYLRQEFNRLNNNSEYTLPNPQWKSRSVVGVVQPLLNGGGFAYNKGIMAVATLDAEVAYLEYERQVQAHLLEISRSYWSLFMARGMTESKLRALEGAESILEELKSREGIDARQTEIQRARAYASERRATLIRSETAILNATERLKTLVNDPNLMVEEAMEFIPVDDPMVVPVQVNAREALLEALKNRSEILQAYKQVEAAVIRRELSAHERMPSLNVFAEAYLAGLDDEDYDGAWDDQEADGPGYLFGLRFEMPIGNNRAKAVNKRRRLEQRQLENQFKTTMETVLLDMRISLREVDSAYKDMEANYDSVRAAREDLANLEGRKEANLLGNKGDPVTELTLLLGAQERLLVAEEKFLRGVATYNVALDSLARAKGTLLDDYGIGLADKNTVGEGVKLISERRKLPVLEMEMSPDQ